MCTPPGSVRRFAAVGLLVGLAACSMEDHRAAPGLPPPLIEAEAGPGPGRLVVDLRDGTSLGEARAATGLDLRWVSPESADEALAVVDVADLAAADAGLVGNPLVELAEPSAAFSALGFPDDPLYPRQWNLRAIGAPYGWRAGGGRGVVVAIVDTGIAAVPDLVGTALAEGVSLVAAEADAVDGNGHGTHVAGTVAQATDNGTGTAGIAPGATLLPIKVLDRRGSGTSEGVAAGIDAAVDRGARVINLSLGGPHAAVVDLAVEKAIAAGVLVVAAVGNTGAEGVSCPAHADGVIGVAATGPDDTRAPYSTWGDGVDLAAPGGDKRKADGGILQDTLAPGGGAGDAYQEFQGTSMATPHVSGAAAVLLGAGLGDAATVEALLVDSARTLGQAGWDPETGAGRLDLAAALRLGTMRRSALPFALGAGAALLMGTIGRLRHKWLLAGMGGMAAGGLFVLSWLPLPPLAPVRLLSLPLLDWPAAMGLLSWTRSPLWVTAAIPAVLTFALGPTRTLGPAVGALSAGLCAWMLHGAWTGAVHVAWLPGPLGSAWLLANAAICAFCALAVAGVQRMQARSEGGALVGAASARSTR